LWRSKYLSLNNNRHGSFIQNIFFPPQIGVVNGSEEYKLGVLMNADMKSKTWLFYLFCKQQTSYVCFCLSKIFLIFNFIRTTVPLSTLGYNFFKDISRFISILCYNRKLFWAPKMFSVFSKNDHQGLVLPAGTKLKPTRCKVLVRDCREHRKQSFYLALVAQDWQEVLTADNVDVAVRIMEEKICFLMDKCMPLRSIRRSSRDPCWMSPLVLSMLRAKTRISLNNSDRLKLENSRISQVISEIKKKSSECYG